MRNWLVTIVVLASTPVWATEGGVSASGRCKKSVPRDRISILFTAVQQSNTSKEAHAQVQKKYEGFRKGVTDLKLKDFEAQTTDISLNPRIEWINNKNVNKGYEGRASLQITTSSIDRVGDLYEQAGKNDIQEFGSLRAFVSDKVFDQAYRQCLKDAVLDAESKAKEMAAAAGRKLGALVYAAEQGASGPMPPMPMMAKSMRGGGMEDSAATNIEAGNGEIEVRVVATFELK